MHMKQATRVGNNDHLIIMLHGTGGSASDLFGIGEILDQDATFVGIEGEVLENGMRRYFKRYADGSFDLESLKEETEKVYNEIVDIVKDYPEHRITVIGYSNGANILTSIFKTFSNVPVDNAILYHPSPTLNEQKVASQKANVMLTSGQQDPFISESEFSDLARAYRSADVSTSVFTHELGHQLLQSELEASKAFLCA